MWETLSHIATRSTWSSTSNMVKSHDNNAAYCLKKKKSVINLLGYLNCLNVLFKNKTPGGWWGNYGSLFPPRNFFKNKVIMTFYLTALTFFFYYYEKKSQYKKINKQLIKSAQSYKVRNTWYKVAYIFLHACFQWQSYPEWISGFLLVTCLSWRASFPHILQALNDYVVGYHDAVVLFGKMMRDNLLAIKKQSYDESSDIFEPPFRNMSFDGKSWKNNTLDQHSLFCKLIWWYMMWYWCGCVFRCGWTLWIRRQRRQRLQSVCGLHIQLKQGESSGVMKIE